MFYTFISYAISLLIRVPVFHTIFYVASTGVEKQARSSSLSTYCDAEDSSSESLLSHWLEAPLWIFSYSDKIVVNEANFRRLCVRGPLIEASGMRCSLFNPW